MGEFRLVLLRDESVTAEGCRYPKRFEIFRLEALGDDPWFTEAQAQERYEGTRGMAIIAGDDPPGWSIWVSPVYPQTPAGFARFAVTLYGPTKTPLREVVWEASDGPLRCQRTLDRFYPEGDPGRWVRGIDTLIVERSFWADGVIEVSMSSPWDDDVVSVIEGAPTSLPPVIAMPEFGEWAELLEASALPAVSRFGPDAIDAAIALAGVAVERGSLVSGTWRVPATDRDTARVVDAVVDGSPLPRLDIPVWHRGAAVIVPLMAQGDLGGGGRDAHEELRRADALAKKLAGAFEYRAGAPLDVDLDLRGDDRVASYSRALRAAGVTRAWWWTLGDSGVVIVWSGDELAGTLTLAVHVVPVSWVWDRKTKPGSVDVDLGWGVDDVRATP